MYVVTMLSYHPKLFDASMRQYEGREMFYSRYDLLNMQAQAHKVCPEALSSIDVRLADIEEYSGQELKPTDSIVFTRTGGAGDIIMILPLIQRMKKAMPSVRIGLATRKKYTPLGSMSPYVDETLSIPSPALAIEKYDYIANFYDAIEFPWAPARTLHGCDVFAERLGLPHLTREEKVPELVPPRGAVRGLDKRLRKDGIKTSDRVLLYQFKGSNINRSLPIGRSAQLVYALSTLAPDVHVIVTGGPRDCNLEWLGRDSKPMPKIHNWAGKTDLYDMVALCQRASLCVAPDSMLAHLGGAMGIPTIALFNVIPPELRVGQYDNVYSFFTPYSCAPCFCHGSDACSKCAILISDWEKRGKKDEPQPGAPCWDTITNREICNQAAQMLGAEG